MVRTISSIVRPAVSTWVDPPAPWRPEVLSSCLISLAAVALRCASERTSPATTAKPLPCSPARAATAAFSARMLVWNAMPSITPTMSSMRLESWAISRMVFTASRTACPPRCATSDAVEAIWLAWRAFSALLLTVESSCSMLAAVSSSEAACCSVRLDRSWLPAAISLDPIWISCTPARTACTVRTRLACMSCR